MGAAWVHAQVGGVSDSGWSLGACSGRWSLSQLVEPRGGRTGSRATQLLLNQQFFHCAKSIEN